jgi:hypothetical protein
LSNPNEPLCCTPIIPTAMCCSAAAPTINCPCRPISNLVPLVDRKPGVAGPFQP